MADHTHSRADCLHHHRNGTAAPRYSLRSLTTATTLKRKRVLLDDDGPPARRHKIKNRPVELTAAAVKKLPVPVKGKAIQSWIQTGSISKWPVMSPPSSSSNKRSRTDSGHGAASSHTTPSQCSNSSSYSPNFARILVDHGVYGPSDSLPPENLKEILDRLAQPRASTASITDEEFEDYRRSHYLAQNEDAVLDNFMSRFPEKPEKCYTARNVAFSRVFVPFAPGLVQVKPDFMSGEKAQRIALSIRQELESFIISGGGAYPVLCNDFTEFKGPDGTERTVIAQITHDGAAGARAMHKMRTYGSEHSPADGIARTFVTSLVGGSTMHYASFMRPADVPGDPPHYFTFPIGGDQPLASAERYRSAVQTYRNLRDLACEERQLAIDEAQKSLEQRQGKLQTGGSSKNKRSSARSKSTRKQSNEE